jgi:hypothetical protein
VIQKIGNRFRREVKASPSGLGIPLLHLKKPDRSRWDDRKVDHVRPHLERAERRGRFGVVAIVAAQEFQWVFGATKRRGARGGVWLDWSKSERRVGTYHFYIRDADFGLGFIKICSWFPYPAKGGRVRRHTAHTAVPALLPKEAYSLLMPERRRRPDLDERFKIETDDPEDALRQLLEVPIDEDDPPEDGDN